MNDHPIEHTYTADFPGGRITYKVTEPYLSKSLMQWGPRTTVTLEKFRMNAASTTIHMGSIEDTEDWLKGCLDALGQLATRDGGEPT